MKNSTRMKRLSAKLDRARSAYQGVINEIEALIAEITGADVDEIVSCDFAGDGLGLAKQNPRDLYMGIDDIIEVLEEKETFTEDDFDYYF